MYDNLSRVIEVDINEILPNRFQPRIQFDEEEILELSDSIKEHGVIQPLVVRTIGDKYEIIAGERRYKASVLAGKETVPVIVKNLNDKESAEIALIENIQRKNLTPIEEALSYKKILDMGYITQENLASKLGKSQSAVANKIRLLNLSDEVQEALLENKISERHARSLLKLSTSKQQNEMLNRIISERLTVRKTDEEIFKLKNDTSNENPDDTQKIIEKGEIEMNNNMFGMPNVPQNPQPTTQNFDIFGTGNQQPVQPQAVANPMPAVNPVSSVPSFDIFGGATQPVESQPVMPSFASTTEMPSASVMPEVPSVQAMPTVENQFTVPFNGGIQFDLNGNVMANQNMQQTVTPQVDNLVVTDTTTPIVEPVVQNVTPAPEMPSVGVMPEVPSVQAMPQSVGSQPVMPSFTSVPEMPSVSSVSGMPEMQLTETPVVQPVAEVGAVDQGLPQTAPIMESPVDNTQQMTQQSENLFSFGEINMNSMESTPSTEQQTVVPEFKMPEPIIITDYSKQYDPVMPSSLENIVPTVDFKEVINAIRECSQKIEQYGFKIDVEEYDLANLYQVIFKIEK